MLYTLSIVSLVLLLLLLAYFHDRWTPYLPARIRSYIGTYSPLSFSEAMDAGLNTGNFNIRVDNVENADDARTGLDAQGLAEVRRLMDRHNLSFDEARLRRQQDVFRRNGIDPDTGLPMDKKAITSLA